MRHKGFVIVALVPLAALTGCFSHNDVLLFGTQTTFGVDIGTAPENGGVPELTLGYKRKEAVWIPLAMNAKDSAVRTSALNIKDIKYEGTTKDSSGQITVSDTYSVFTSLGVDVKAGTQESGVSRVAQFFATGIAARELGANPDVAKLIRVESANQRAVDMAEAQAKQAAIELKKVRTTAFSAEAKQKRIDKILDAIDNSARLSDAKAIELEEYPPVQDQQVNTIVAARDPGGARQSDPAVAREMLKMRVVMSANRSDEALAAWEAAVKAAE